MAVTHGAATRNSISDAVLADIDLGTGAGVLVFLTAADAEVATCTLSDPAGTVSGAVLTFSAITSDTSATGGTIAKFEIRDSDATVVLAGSVTATGGGGDITMPSLVVGAGATVSVTSLTYTAPA